MRTIQRSLGLGPGTVLPDGTQQVCPLWPGRVSPGDLCVVSAGGSSQGCPQGQSPCIPLSVGCELNSSTRAQGGTGQSLDGPHLHGQPLLGQRLEGKMRPEAAQPPVGTRVCVTIVCTPVLLMLLSRCTTGLRDQTASPPWFRV